MSFSTFSWDVNLLIGIQVEEEGGLVPRGLPGNQPESDTVTTMLQVEP